MAHNCTWFSGTNISSSINIERISHYNHQQYLPPKIESLTEDFQVGISNGLVGTLLRIGGTEIEPPLEGLYVNPWIDLFENRCPFLFDSETEGWMQGMRAYEVHGSYDIRKNKVGMELDSLNNWKNLWAI